MHFEYRYLSTHEQSYVELVEFVCIEFIEFTSQELRRVEFISKNSEPFPKVIMQVAKIFVVGNLTNTNMFFMKLFIPKLVDYRNSYRIVCIAS